MPRPRNPIPKYRHHKPTGQAVVTLVTSEGRKDVYLGAYNTARSKAEYSRIIGEIQSAGPAAVVQRLASTRPSVNEVLLAFLRYATVHYQSSDGKETRELGEYRQCCCLMRGAYGDRRADEFGPVSLKALRQKMVDGGLSRKLINRRVARIRRIFKWAVSEELVPPAVYQALASLQGLQAGRSGARETKPIEPVAESVVNATLPYLNPTVRAMVEVQLFTGMRPGEVCRLRPQALDTSGPVWLYRPATHKNAWRGKSRVIAIGPKAQAILKPFTPAAPVAYFFSPRRAVEQFHASRGLARQTPRYRSHMERNKKNRKTRPKRVPAELYDVNAYGHAIDRACDAAFPPPPALRQRSDETKAAWWKRLTEAERDQVKSSRRSHRWHPNQLRHSFATKVRREHGLEAAQVALGHAKADVTQVYAERDLDLALRVAESAG